jgi:antitoxin CcdA
VKTRGSSHDSNAAKKTVSLTINSDLYARAKKLGINASAVAENALAAEVAQRMAAQVRAEIAQDLEAISSYEEKHGSFADMVRAHYQDED